MGQAHRTLEPCRDYRKGRCAGPKAIASQDAESESMKRFKLINANDFLKTCQGLSASIRHRPLLISIDGRSGSGKTLFSLLLKACLLRASIPVTTMKFDDFWIYSDVYKRLCAANAYRPLRESIGYTYDWPCFKHNILEPLRNFDPAPIRNSNWINTLLPGGRDGLRSGGAVIIEGCTTQRKELLNLYAYGSRI
jgi:hypothetical protein